MSILFITQEAQETQEMLRFFVRASLAVKARLFLFQSNQLHST